MTAAAEAEVAAAPDAGRGVRIGVIDSGVFPRHPHIGPVVGGVAILPEGEVSDDPRAWLDRIGHGTAVTAAIQEKAPAAEIHAVKVFHDGLKTSGATLVRAIDWCVAQRLDLVNLSLGSTNPAHRELFAQAVERAAAAGVTLVAARQNGEDLCYPGALPGVVGVGLDWDVSRDRYDLRAVDGASVCYASGYPRPVPGVPAQRNLSGISFAVANVTGLLAARLSGSGDGGPAAVQALLSASPPG
ncbi:MAG: S8 family serine peptidase [Pseudomonadota bacterium]